MDISAHISELLFEHDCIIIPGFGGFVCSYAPAEIHAVENTVYPPSKAITFNRNLQNNDGLLVNYLASTEGMSYESASTFVERWVEATKAMLNSGEVVLINKVGRFNNDIENNLQFKVDENINYLKTSYGLRKVSAYPVMRQRTLPIDDTDTTEYNFGEEPRKRSQWKVAAIIILLIGLGAMAQLMWMGVAIKPLQLNEAGVASFLNNIFKSEPAEIEPIAIISTTTTVAEPVVTEPVATEPTVIEPTISEPVTTIPSVATAAPANGGYYIIIGAFKRGKNIDAAKAELALAHGDSNVLIDNNGSLTRIGYYAGATEAVARQALHQAKGTNADAWLFKK